MILMFIVLIITIIGIVAFIVQAANKKRKGERLGEDGRHSK
jgi:FtsZ-interacting cell division protein ZipA